VRCPTHPRPYFLIKHHLEQEKWTADNYNEEEEEEDDNGSEVVGGQGGGGSAKIRSAIVATSNFRLGQETCREPVQGTQNYPGSIGLAAALI
jgi:hypothetical protein